MKTVILFLFWGVFTSKTTAQKVELTFFFKGSAKTAFVAGSFNQWSESAHPMYAVDSGMVAKITVTPGYYYYKFIVDGKWISDPGNPWMVKDGWKGWNSIVKAGEPETPKRASAVIPFDTATVPRPFYPARPDYLALYYKAWQLLWNNRASGTPENGFSPAYLDEGFNELIYQWDSCFMAAFALYGGESWPAMASLDNFYAKQRSDGYIQRVYREKDGEPVGTPSSLEPNINPPLFAWMELRYYRITGDVSRLARVFPKLKAYYGWLEKNTRSSLSSDLFFNTALGSGMDNIPRPEGTRGAWIDASAQMALFARNMRDLAEPAGYPAEKARFSSDYVRISKAVNHHLWSTSSRFYHDSDSLGRRSPSLHAGAFWTLTAGIAGSAQAKALSEKLYDSTHFFRSHQVPALSASDPAYRSSGHYWRGGVWAPVNFMIVQGLSANGARKQATDIVKNHLDNIAALYKSGIQNETIIPFEQRFKDGYQTIWEAYAPDAAAPASRWDDRFAVRQDFVGWSGLGPIALFIEYIIGLEPVLAENKVIWHLESDEPVGIRNLKIGKYQMDFTAEPEKTGWLLTIRTNHPFELQVKMQNRTTRMRITPERHSYRVKRILE